MSEKAIGVFDSGLGGLTTVKELLNFLKQENIIYFGDTGRVPYGNRSQDTIKKYALQDASFLLTQNVKMIIAACGTVSSVAADLGDKLSVPFTGVVTPTAAAAVSSTYNGKIGVIGTTATIASGAYKREIEKMDSRISVYQQDCPLFVPLVENGFTSTEDPIVQLIVERYLAPIKETDIDTLILGCTHYPILAQAISRFVGERVRLIDSGRETALYAATMLKNKHLLNQSGQKGKASFYVSDKIENFSHLAGIFLGRNMNHTVTHVDIEQFEE